jgi:hypothetical protein
VALHLRRLRPGATEYVQDCLAQSGTLAQFLLHHLDFKQGVVSGFVPAALDDEGANALTASFATFSRVVDLPEGGQMSVYGGPKAFF